MNFTLHPSLQKKIFIHDLKLCQVLMEDELHYPWLILVPKKPDLKKLIDLDWGDQLILMQEMDLCQRILWDLYQPAQLNVAQIGNKTPQLHIHIIARFENDPCWPKTVWEQTKTRLDPGKKQTIVSNLQEKFKALFKNEELLNCALSDFPPEKAFAKRALLSSNSSQN